MAMHGTLNNMLREIFEYAHLKFMVYGHKQASKQASIHTHVPQCGHASVGLAQAHSNELLCSGLFSLVANFHYFCN